MELETGLPGRHLGDDPVPHACATRFAECTCANCVRSLQLITWYGQTPGNHLSRLVMPHQRKWEQGADLQALLRSKAFFTTAFTMRYVTLLFMALGLAQLYAGFSQLPEKLMATSTAKCAVVRVTPHSLRNGEPVFASVNASDWEFGLLYNGCTVPMGKPSADPAQASRRLIFAEPVEFNGYYLTSRTAQRGESDTGFDPLSFTLECLSRDGEPFEGSTPVTLAASGSCGWFADVTKAVHVVNPPPSEWHTAKDHLGKDGTRIRHDYSETKFGCKLPVFVDHLSVIVSGAFFLLLALQARHDELFEHGIFGIKYPVQTFGLGCLLSSVLVIITCLLSWQIDYQLIVFHLGRFVWLLGVILEQFPEENIVLFGVYTVLLGVWASFSSFEGTTHTAFYARDVATSMTPRCVYV